MDSRTGYSPVRPLVIALCIILVLSLVLSCVRRKRALALRQQQLAQQSQTAELGDVAYIYQGATSSSTTTAYTAPQDGSANLTNADISEGVPAVPPPPYTAAMPK
ncbi:hypothetical protein BGW39_004901 [Mortierella sp. 14UC]|nr:hypothetical protein BGW39_004901 [Mortierella sp. 14UC]